MSIKKCFQAIKKTLSCRNICSKCRKSNKTKKASVETPTKYNPDYDQEAQISKKVEHKPNPNCDAHKNINSANTNDQTSNDKSSDDQFSSPVNDKDVKGKDGELPVEINIVHIKIDNE